MLHHARYRSNELLPRRSISLPAWELTLPPPWSRPRFAILSQRLPVSTIIRIVEHLLNLLWLSVASVLAFLAVRGHQRGALRCSLLVALGCTALIALVLFPALSMTDDLQRAKLDTETSSRHLGNTLLLGSPDDPTSTPVEILPLLMAMAQQSRMASAGRLMGLTEAPRLTDRPGVRPESPRPPPAPAIA